MAYKKGELVKVRVLEGMAFTVGNKDISGAVGRIIKVEKRKSGFFGYIVKLQGIDTPVSFLSGCIRK